MLVTTHYADEHYSTIFNPGTGFFARVEDDGYPEPTWSKHGPELLDISTTNWCERQCPICYRNSGRQGRHMQLAGYQKIMRQAAGIGVVQVALGGGNPNQHPEFSDIVRSTRTEYNIVPSYTTNGRGLTAEVIEASARYCGAVAVSAYQPYESLHAPIKALISAGVRTNIHFVLDADSIKTAISWLRDPPTFLSGINAIIFLNYKPVGRLQDPKALLQDSRQLEEFFEIVGQSGQHFRIGFDSCMVSGLVSYTSINPSFFDACEAGRFSMFISEDMEMYPCSFMESLCEGVPVTEDNMLTAWRGAKPFQVIRGKLLAGRCPDCTHSSVCMGGCPVFEEINLCRTDPREARRGESRTVVRKGGSGAQQRSSHGRQPPRKA